MVSLVFDRVMVKQLRKVAEDENLKSALTKMLDIIESNPGRGKLLDSKLQIYEIRRKRPPIRLYYMIEGDRAYVFEFEMKRSDKRQSSTIERIKDNVRSRDRRE